MRKVCNLFVPFFTVTSNFIIVILKLHVINIILVSLTKSSSGGHYVVKVIRYFYIHAIFIFLVSIFSGAWCIEHLRSATL